jgi:hypothetical protein
LLVLLLFLERYRQSRSVFMSAAVQVTGAFPPIAANPPVGGPLACLVAQPIRPSSAATPPPPLPEELELVAVLAPELLDVPGPAPPAPPELEPLVVAFVELPAPVEVGDAPPVGPVEVGSPPPPHATTVVARSVAASDTAKR